MELDPQNGAYHDSLGWALYRLNRLEAAEEAVRRALDKDGDNAVVLDHLGDILARRGRAAEALELLAEGAQGRGRGERARPRARGGEDP